MSIIEQIKAEIERLKNKMDERDPLAPNQKAGYLFALADVLFLLSTLESEKLINQERLDQEIIKCWQEWISPSNEQSVEGVLPLSEFAFYARHFAKWQKEQMVSEAVEGYVNYYEDSGGILMAEAQVGCPYHNGDKVHIIIVKED